jgi:WbqC-like protein family
VRAVITQSNYIPWKGSFDVFDRADVVVLYDDVQYTRRDWRNRNRIKTAQGTKWITVPVRVKGRYTQNINEVEISDTEWAKSHWGSIEAAYAKAPYFARYGDRLLDLYQQASKLSMLSTVNHLLLTEIGQWLRIDTPFRWSTEFAASGGQTERLVGICQELGATEYLSGPAAKSYLDVEQFEQVGIAVEWMDFSHYPPYPQLHGAFEPAVSVIDVLFNCGDDAPNFVCGRNFEH